MGPGDPASLGELARDPLIVASGEIGLDFYRDHSPRDVQLKAFDSLLEAAAGAGKPVVIHTRDAHAETVAMLDAHRDSLSGILIHCFTGGPAEAEGYLGLGCYISVPGVITYKNAGPLREACALIPKDRLLIETDSPYLAPVPRRGRRNEPSYLPHLLEGLGRVLGMEARDAAALTAANARRFFGLEGARKGVAAGDGTMAGTGDGPGAAIEAGAATGETSPRTPAGATPGTSGSSQSGRNAT
jgi:TatD DNase family protein